MPGTEITNISYHQEFQGCAPHTHDQIIAGAQGRLYFFTVPTSHGN